MNFTFKWQRDTDCHTNGTHPGTGYSDLWECVCLDERGVPQASRGGLHPGDSRAAIEALLVIEAKAWMELRSPAPAWMERMAA